MKYAGSSPEKRREEKVGSYDTAQIHKGRTTEAKIKALSILKDINVQSQWL